MNNTKKQFTYKNFSYKNKSLSSSLLLSLMLSLLLILSISASAEPLSSVDYKYSGGTYAINDGIEITLLSQDPDPVEPGKYVTLRFKVENTGSKGTDDLFLKLNADYPFSFDNAYDSVLHVGKMLAKQEGDNAAIAKFKVRVDKKAVEGTSYVDLQMFFNNDRSTAITIKDFPISIKTIESVLEISSIKTTPEQTPQGSQGTISITLKNVADSYIDNIQINLGYLDTLAPISDSNEKVVEHLGPGESTTVDFDFVVDPNSESKVYKLPITLKYYDSNSKNYTKEAVVGVMVGDKPEIVTRLAYVDEISSGDSGRVTIQFINKGLTNVRRTYAKLMSNPGQYTVIGADNVYLGDIDSDDMLPANFHIKTELTSGNEINLRLNVEYRDENNKLYTEQIEVPVQLKIKSFSISGTSITIGVICILVLVLIGYFIRNAKRKK